MVHQHNLEWDIICSYPCRRVPILPFSTELSLGTYNTLLNYLIPLLFLLLLFPLSAKLEGTLA